MATAHESGKIIIWDVQAQIKKTELNAHTGSPCTGIAFSPVNNLLLCSCGLDGKIQFFDIKSEKQVKSIENIQNPFSSIAFCSDGHTIAAGSLKGKIYIYDLKEKQKVKIELKGQEGKKINCLQFFRPASKDLSKMPSSLTYFLASSSKALNEVQNTTQSQNNSSSKTSQAKSPISGSLNQSIQSKLSTNVTSKLQLN